MERKELNRLKLVLVEKKRTGIVFRLEMTSMCGIVVATVYYSYKLYSIFYIEFENVYPYTNSLFENFSFV